MFKKLAVLAALLGGAGLVMAQGIIGVFQNGNPLAPSVYGVGDSTSGFYFGTGYAAWSRHIATGSIATNNLPVLSNGGASPVLGTGSTDTAGTMASTTGTTTLTLTFGTAWNAAPVCIVQEQGGTVAPTYTVSTTAITATVVVAAATYNYLCLGRNGG